MTLTLLISLGENENVHIRPDVGTPVDVYETGRLTVEPRAALPDARLSVGAPKLAWTLATSKIARKTRIHPLLASFIKDVILRKYYTLLVLNSCYSVMRI